MAFSLYLLLLLILNCFITYQAEYPTLSAFTEFVIEFDMPSCSNTRKKDTNVIDVGRPFRPAMFEQVLKNFTPDIPSGISGRPRYIMCIDFYVSFLLSSIVFVYRI